MFLEIPDDTLLCDGLEQALIGIGTRFSYSVAIYDEAKVLEVLMARDGMTYEEAAEFFEFNIAGAYVGEHTPVFLRSRGDELEESR